MTLRAAIMSLALSLGLSPTAGAHDWYPAECCSGQDCAPVTSVAMTTPISSADLPQLIVTTEIGTALVPPDFKVRESKDHRMHACMKLFDHNPATRLICLFVPPQM